MMPPITQTAPDRQCGSCTLCCKVMAINELQKPRGVWCTNCAPGKGCKIYDSRPDECRSFNCGWLINPEFGDEWKPDKAKMVLTPARGGNGIEVRCDPGYPGAWRRSPYYEAIQDWAETAKQHDGTVIVCVGAKMTLVAPEGEFSLGEVGENDRIVREMRGQRLVGAKVMKD
jgi:hypothetical protein